MSKVDIQHAVDVLSNLAQSEGDVGYEYWMSIIKLLKQSPAVPETVSKTWISQFCTDVTTAAGLLNYGKRDKGLAKRISDDATRLRLSVIAENNAPPVPALPDGYVLVPIEPTPKMCKAAYWAKDKWHSTQCDTQDELYFSFAQPRWKAMLAAAKGGA